MDPIPEKIRGTANALAQSLANALPKGVGFALFLFDLGPGGTMSYISNANRADMIEAIRELLVNMEKDK
jgi:hypothetical protein